MADSEKAPAAPPNLRVSTDESRECDSCRYFDQGHCTMFPPLVVNGEWVCDKYASNGKGDPDAFQGKNLKQAEQEAYVRVRAHRRRVTNLGPGQRSGTSTAMPPLPVKEARPTGMPDRSRNAPNSGVPRSGDRLK